MCIKNFIPINLRIGLGNIIRELRQDRLLKQIEETCNALIRARMLYKCLSDEYGVPTDKINFPEKCLEKKLDTLIKLYKSNSKED